MASEQEQRRRPQRAVVQAQPGQRHEADGAQRALVAVTHEIDNRLAIIGTSSAAGIDPDRLKLVALGAFTRTPALWTCDPVSVARSIVEAGQLGLEPTGLLGGAYLVPRKGQCTLLVGYRGLVMLAKRSGEVARVEARVVRQRDAFDYGYGLEPYLHHVPAQDGDPGAYTQAYAVLVYRDGGRQFDVMSLAEIETIRKRSSSPNDGPWVTDWPEMAKKTVLRRLLKLAPLTINVAAQLDEIDPEVPTVHHERPAYARQAELRAQLQQALEREYGAGQVSEGAYREVPTTEGAGTVGAAGAESKAAAKGVPAPQAAAEPAQGAAAEEAPAAAPTRGGKPEPVGAVLGVEPAPCGANHEGLGVGPCVLPAEHQAKLYRVGGTTYPPQQEHEEAGGTRWTQPR